MTIFVFVHGAFHGGWCWEFLCEELESRGHRAIAVDLPASGDDPTPAHEVTLVSAAERVIELIKTVGEPIVLVGHSMGGIVITQVADRIPETIDRLVYIAAFRPRNGECLLDLVSREEASTERVGPNSTFEGNPPIIANFNLEMARDVFYNDCSEELAQWAIDRLGPQTATIFMTPVSLNRGPHVSTDYVICTEDVANPVQLQRTMATRDPARVFNLASGHSPFLSRPEDLADILTHP